MPRPHPCHGDDRVISVIVVDDTVVVGSGIRQIVSMRYAEFIKQSWGINY